MVAALRMPFMPSLEEFEEAVEAYARAAERRPCEDIASLCPVLQANRMWETDLELLAELAFGEDFSRERGWREFQPADVLDDGLVSLDTVHSWIRSRRETGPWRREPSRDSQETQFSAFGFFWFWQEHGLKTVKRAEPTGFCSLVDAFLRYDCDSNGVICAKDLRFALAQLTGEELPLEDCKQMIQRVDANNDGVVDLAEFVQMMGHVSRREVTHTVAKNKNVPFFRVPSLVA